MKRLKQKPGEKPKRVGTWKEITLNKNNKPNTCIIEPGDVRMPPVSVKGNWWEWISFDRY